MKSKLIIVLILLSSRAVNAEIITADHLSAASIETIVNQVDDNSLVLIELEETIVTPSSNMFRQRNNPYKSFINDLISQTVNRPYLQSAITAFYNFRKSILIDPLWPSFIEKLKNRGANVYGFTSMNKGIYYSFKEPEIWKYNEITAYGIRFSESLKGAKAFSLGSNGGKAAVFYRGIIFNGFLGKKQVLNNFLKAEGNIPRKVFVFDYNLKNIQMLKNYFYNFNVKFYGINYTGVKNIDGIPNPDIIKFQQSVLIRNGKWMEDAEALKSYLADFKK